MRAGAICSDIETTNLACVNAVTKKAVLYVCKLSQLSTGYPIVVSVERGRLALANRNECLWFCEILSSLVAQGVTPSTNLSGHGLTPCAKAPLFKLLIRHVNAADCLHL